ncbi:MAG TPA: uridine kinase [Polyangiaceae bacterium]|nr:uridine kinase [Polyangiaceae bacterium]
MKALAHGAGKTFLDPGMGNRFVADDGSTQCANRVGLLGVSPLVVGIAGGTGSGKSTVARELVRSLPDHAAALIQHDWYYRDRSHLSEAERESINFDEPAALDNELLVEHLLELKCGRAVACPQYDFVTHTRAKASHHVEPRSIVLVEGILIFAVRELRQAFDLRLFVDTDDDIRLLRRVQRDMRERGRDLSSIESQYLNTVRPMHQLHVAPTRQFAHLIIPEGGENVQALDVIVGRLRYLLARAGSD